MNNSYSHWTLLAAGAVVLGVGAYSLCLTKPSPADDHDDHEHATAGSSDVLELNPQARKNLGLVVRPLAVSNYWKTIQLPGTVVDRPGRTDRGVTSPIAGVVIAVHAFPGDIVKPGELLFSIRPSSQYVQKGQAELFQATRAIELLQEQKDRLQGVVASGAVAGARLIEINQEMSLQTAKVEALRQDLRVRGLTAGQIEGAARGTFATTINIFVPDEAVERREVIAMKPVDGSPSPSPSRDRLFEVQELSVELGQQVEMGAVLCLIADHETLFVEGHAFRQDATHLERAVGHNWPVQIEFSEASENRWPPLEQSFHIHHLSNAVDPESRTFACFIPLRNQFLTYEKDGREYVVWRFRPGERVRLHVPVEELEDVFVLPASGVARDGPEAYVFRQNGDLFKRLPVHVLHEDRRNVVIANDGSVRAGFYVAQNAAASLSRVLKVQTASGAPVGVHVHADGTIHGSH